MEFSALAEGLQHIGIPTGDMEKSLAFYRTIGFREELLTNHPDTGETIVHPGILRNNMQVIEIIP